MTKQFFVGTFTKAAGGEARGISVYERRTDGVIGELLQEIEIETPSVLEVTDDFVFAASATDGIVAYRRVDGRLERISASPSGGAGPCHLVFEPDPGGGGSILVANYFSGTVGRLPIGADGTVGPVVLAPQPNSPLGPDTQRQDGSHAHAAVRSPWGTVLTTDLGRDRVLEYEWTDLDAPELVAEHEMPAGSGPRHVAWSHGRLLVVGELDATLNVLERRGSSLVHVGSVPTGDPDLTTERSFPSHIEIHPDHDVAYVGNRHRETLSVFDVSDLERGGLPRLMQEIAVDGKNPWHFVIDGTHLVVANMLSHTLMSFEILGDGRLGAVTQTIDTKSPTFVTAA